MRTLCLADLHHNFYEEPGDTQQERALLDVVARNAPLDAVVIAGDIYEHSLRKSPYAVLARLFGDVTSAPVICCLGNHEFLFQTPQYVRERMADLYRPNKHDVHYLDVVGSFKVGKYTFVGNVLWYDGSMKPVLNQNLYDWAGRQWADRLIREFKFEHEHARCLQQIRNNLAPSHNILVTHCVPFRQLNSHYSDSLLNAYSGVDNILASLGGQPDITAAICGHTHRRVIGEINGVRCVNPGNDYGWPPLLHYVLELED